MTVFRSVATFLAGRWQIPLAVSAVVLAGVTVLRLSPPAKNVPFDALLADIFVLVERGAYIDAADSAANLLEMKPPLSQDQQARLHEVLADVIYRQELARGLPNANNARLLLSHERAATALGVSVTAQRALRSARAFDWSGQKDAAESAYREVLVLATSGDARREALQGLVNLLEGQAEKAVQRREYNRQLLDDEGISVAYLWDALQSAVQEALDGGDFEEARRILTRHGQGLRRSDQSGYHDYLWAWLYVSEGNSGEAGPLIERVDQWLDAHPYANAEMDRAGYLPAMNRWLRGRIALAEDRPQAALSDFDEVLAVQVRGNLPIQATRGRMAALAALHRHEAVRVTVRKLIEQLGNDPRQVERACSEMRRDVLALTESRQSVDDHEEALAYLELSLEITPVADEATRLHLLEQLGHAYATAATGEEAGADAGRLHAAAARAFEQAAELARFDEPRLATLLWESALQYDQAGSLGDALRLLNQFVSERSFDPRLPQALLRLGRAYAAAGDIATAIAQYDRLSEAYPKLDEAAVGRYLKAGCLIALGEEHFDRAESLLQNLLEDDGIAPQAAVFHDALLALCELLYMQGRYAEAIGRLEDFETFYPEDAAMERVCFMLADAHRGSALALMSSEGSGTYESRRQAGLSRFKRAAELFGEYAERMERKTNRSEEDEFYLQLAMLNRGDCLMELNDPEALAEALSVYRTTAARYQDRPTALAAQVQAANILLRQGKHIEAARAIERARWQLGGIPDGAFEEYDDGMNMNRAGWDRYLQALQTSDLFKDVFATAP